MRRPASTQAHQLETFARFLDEHPTFSPLLCGDDALVYAFQAGASALDVAAMETLIATQPHFAAREAELLLAPFAAPGRHR